jgi:cobalt-zinc-cadmium efflux system protein
MSHDHHHHGHDGASGRLGLAFALNVAFTLIELFGAWLTNSTAIAADALHDLGDSLSLAFAWGMEGLSRRAPTSTYTYGFRRLSLVGAWINALVLLVGGGLVLGEAIPRLWSPGQPNAAGMLGLAVLGVLVNGAAVLRVRTGTTLNERVVTWHLLEDVLGWVAVLLVSIVMLFADVPILDPILSIGVTLWVGFNAARNLKRTMDVFLQAVPEDVDVGALRAEAEQIDGVVELRHVHVWSQEGEHHVLTADLVVNCTSLDEALALLQRVRHRLRDVGIAHSTLQLAEEQSLGGPGASPEGDPCASQT